MCVGPGFLAPRRFPCGAITLVVNGAEIAAPAARRDIVTFFGPRPVPTRRLTAWVNIGKFMPQSLLGMAPVLPPSVLRVPIDIR